MDKYTKNNIVERTIVHYPALKLQILEGEIPEFYCSDRIKAKILVKNLGFDTISTLDFNIWVNGNPFTTHQTALSVPFGQLASFEIELNNIEENDQHMELALKLMDQLAANEASIASKASK